MYLAPFFIAILRRIHPFVKYSQFSSAASGASACFTCSHRSETIPSRDRAPPNSIPGKNEPDAGKI